MGSPNKYLYQKLSDFFEIFPLETIRETIAENKSHTKSNLDMNARGFLDEGCNSDDKSDQLEKISGAFDKVVSGYDDDVCKDIITYSQIAYQAYMSLNKEAKSMPEPDYFVKRVNLCLEKGFNQKVRADNFLQEFDQAVMALWEMENRLEDNKITHMGSLLSHTEDDVFDTYYPEDYEGSKPLVRTIMKVMMQNKGLDFDIWNKGNNRRPQGQTL